MLVVFYNPSAVFEAKSITPDTGLKTNPAIPFEMPYKNPKVPY